MVQCFPKLNHNKIIYQSWWRFLILNYREVSLLAVAAGISTLPLKSRYMYFIYSRNRKSFVCVFSCNADLISYSLEGNKRTHILIWTVWFGLLYVKDDTQATGLCLVGTSLVITSYFYSSERESQELAIIIIIQPYKIYKTHMHMWTQV